MDIGGQILENKQESQSTFGKEKQFDLDKYVIENLQNNPKCFAATFLNNLKINSSKDILKKNKMVDALVALNKKSGLYVLDLLENKINKNSLDLVL